MNIPNNVQKHRVTHFVKCRAEILTPHQHLYVGQINILPVNVEHDDGNS